MNDFSSLFTTQLIDWQRRHGRHDLPWQNDDDPYTIWLSEIMLQQTQVSTVRDYYLRFIARFPTVESLAAAHEDEVLALWAGLGYYRRARHLHEAARQIVTVFGGQFPRTRHELETLKGVGRSTAAAIAAFAFRQPETILDGNVRRVLCRVFALDGDERDRAFTAALWAKAESLLPENRDDVPAYIQGLMDLGATVCTRRPNCAACPQRLICRAVQENRVAELPRKKTAVTVREWDLSWLVILSAEQEIFLEKRAAHGIWGGMWCVPCYEDAAAQAAFCREHDLPPPDVGEPFTHRLTHRLLTITPYYFRLPETQFLRSAGEAKRFAASHLGSANNARFFPLSQAAQQALPKPLSRLLQTLAGSL
ncbi:MAG: A/G-specific adenine glycosylase [Neisseria sp.]|nr:A/G-specific adenine glycosylase [Neisseria sp.]